jgi:hypothetical protein
MSAPPEINAAMDLSPPFAVVISTSRPASLK